MPDIFWTVLIEQKHVIKGLRKMERVSVFIQGTRELQCQIPGEQRKRADQNRSAPKNISEWKKPVAHKRKRYDSEQGTNKNLVQTHR